MNTGAGRQTDIILLDFSKAFDKISHSKLILKDQRKSWIRAFLGNRSQTGVLEGGKSGSVPETSGCPMGQTWGLSCSLYT